MQVMILAAGRSTRLGALGSVRPKPLVPVCGYPAIAFGLSLCARAGLRDVVINVHHHADQIRAAVGDGSAYGVQVRYSDESELLLGTGGALVRARPLFKPGPVLVMNGKVVADVDLAAVVQAHLAAAPRALATMVLRPEARLSDYSPIAVDDSGRVVGIRGRRGPMTTIGSVSELMFTGIHVLEPGLLDRLPAGVSDVIGEAYLPALEEGGRISSLRTSGYFAEHSTPERYLAGNLALLRAPSLIPHPPGPLAGVDPRADVNAGAEIRHPVRIAAGAVIEDGAVVGPDVVIGVRARVARGARLERAVVWDDVVVEGPLTDAVGTSDGVVRAPRD